MSSGTPPRIRRSVDPVVVLAVVATVVVALLWAMVLRNSSAASEGQEARGPAPVPTQAKAGLVANIVGDSHFANTAGPEQTAVADRIGDAMGWQYATDVVGGTGFLAKGGDGEQPTFGEYVSDIVAVKPDVVLIEGGGNDGDYDIEELESTVAEDLSTLRSGLPKAKIVLIAPLYTGAPDETGMAVRDAIASAAESVSRITYIDPVADEWFPGTNKAEDGPGREYVSDDLIHANAKGNDLLVSKVVEALKQRDVPAVAS